MWAWLVVAVLAAIGELLSYDLFLAPVAVAAVVVALIAPVSPVPLQVALFGGLSLLGITVLRPIVRHALGLDSRIADIEPVGYGSVVGRRGIVTQTVDANGGQIRIGEGEFWTARPLDLDRTFTQGEAVEVLLVDGLAALVDAERPLPALTASGTHPSIEKGIES